jgi:hypothetical protein
MPVSFPVGVLKELSTDERTLMIAEATGLSLKEIESLG